MSLRYHKTVLADNVNLVAEGSDGSVHLDHLGNMFAIAVNVHHIMALAASSMAGPPAHSRSGFMRASFRLSDLHDCTGNTTSFLTPSECQLRALVISEKEKRNSLSQKYREAERKEANGDFVLNSDRAKSVWAYFFCTGFKGGLFGIHTCCIHYRPSIWMIQSITSAVSSFLLHVT